MKILHVFDHSLPLHSGYTFRSAALLAEQRARGWQTVHLTSPRQRSADAVRETVGELLLHRTASPPRWLGQIPGARECAEMALLRRRLDALVREEKPDVIHAHSPVLNAWPALQVARAHGLPVVYEIRAFWEDAAVDHGTTHEGSARYRLTHWLETEACRRVDAVTTICEGLRRDLVARGVAPGQVTIIPNGVDVGRFRFAPEDDEALREGLGLAGHPVIGFIGSFYAYEGLDLLLEALPGIWRIHPEVRVLLVGGGPEEARLRANVAQRGFSGRVIFSGRIPHAEISRYYGAIDLQIYARHSMRLTELVTPLKPLEAMAQGRLFIASDVGGHRELVQDGGTGRLFRAGDPGALAAAVCAMLADRASWPGLRTAARRHVEEERTWAMSAARYESVYAQAIARCRGLGAATRAHA